MTHFRSVTRSALAVVACLAATVAAPGTAMPQAQTPPAQSEPTYTLPDYTTQERWTRSAGVTSTVAGIRMTKENGGTAVTHGQFSAGVFVTGWGAANSGTPFGFARNMHRNLMSNPHMQFELTSASATEANGRYLRAWVEQFGPTRALYGVTLDEYEESGRVFNTLIASYLGMDWTQRAEGDWMVFSVKKRPAVTTPFAMGAYATTITPQDMNAASKAGAYRLILTDGRYTVALGGQSVAEGTYTLANDLITFSRFTGSDACRTAGTYRWKADPNGLSLERLAELCSNRSAIFTTHPFTRVGER